jgi:hypothetical protein
MRYELEEDVLFVDARDYLTNKKYPKEIPFPHILDQRVHPNIYLKLNEGASYITRFIVQGVDTALIAEILRSEYRTSEGDKVDKVDFEAEVHAVLRMIKTYLKEPPRGSKRGYEPPKSLGRGKHEGGYELDFSVHSFVIGCCKFPC